MKISEISIKRFQKLLMIANCIALILLFCPLISFHKDTLEATCIEHGETVTVDYNFRCYLFLILDDKAKGTFSISYQDGKTDEYELLGYLSDIKDPLTFYSFSAARYSPELDHYVSLSCHADSVWKRWWVTKLFEDDACEFFGSTEGEPVEEVKDFFSDYFHIS